MHEQCRGWRLAAAVCLVALILPSNNLILAAPDYITELYEGNACAMEDGSEGVCIELPKCPYRIKEVLAGKRFSTSTGRCSFKNFVEIVCCPKDDANGANGSNGNNGNNGSNGNTGNNGNNGNTGNNGDNGNNGNNGNTGNNGDNGNNGNNGNTGGNTGGIGGNISEKLGLRPADVVCHEYENEIIGGNGEKVNTNIFNGERANAGEFPYMVALGYQTDKENPSFIKYNCGGTLISVQHVVTAAHCVNNINNFVPVEIRIGSVDLDDNSKDVQRIPVAEVIAHPQHRQSLNYYDIAILKLRRSVNVSKNVMPICLQTKPIPNLAQLLNMSLVVTGWGATSFEDEGSNILQKTPTLSIVDRTECSQHYKDFSRLPRGVDESMICVLDMNVTRRADACQGDSGGPLILLSHVSSTILGVTSFGQSCGSSVPAIYTSILSYLSWIEEVVWPNKKRSL